jgi:hypothetical protein
VLEYINLAQIIETSKLMPKGKQTNYQSRILFLLKMFLKNKPGVVAHSYNYSTWEAEAGG